MIDVKYCLTEIADLEFIEPGGWEVDICQIQHGTGATYKIGWLVREVHLFEDIESMGVTGYLQIEDNVNMIRNGLIIGEELLYLKFATGGTKEAGVDEFAVDYSKDPLYIHKVEALETKKSSTGQPSSSAIEYRLHFCSTEMVTNNRIRLSKTYQGTIGATGSPGSDGIIYDIMKKDLNVIKPLHIAQTHEIHHFISPNMHPFDLISTLSTRATARTGLPLVGPQPDKTSNLFGGGKTRRTRTGTQSTMQERSARGGDRHADFLMFEAACRLIPEDGGWFFQPLQKEKESEDMKIALNSSPTTTGANPDKGEHGFGDNEWIGYPGAMMRTINYEYLNYGDKWETIRSGAWAGTQIKHNSVTKSFEIYESDYLKHLKKDEYSHASTTTVFWPNKAPYTISEWPKSNVSYASSAARSTSNINSGTKRVDYPWSIGAAEHPLLRKMQMNHLFNYERVVCEMWGNSGIQLGRNVLTKFPEIGMASGDLQKTGLVEGEEKWPENRDSNVWIISKVGHHIDIGDHQGYKTTVEIVNTRRSTQNVLPFWGNVFGGPGELKP